MHTLYFIRLNWMYSNLDSLNLMRSLIKTKKKENANAGKSNHAINKKFSALDKSVRELKLK